MHEPVRRNCILIAGKSMHDNLVKKLLIHTTYNTSFLSTQLKQYDHTSIAVKVANIHKYVFSDYCNMEIFIDEKFGICTG